MLSRDRIGALLMLAFTLGYGSLSFRIPLLPFQAEAAFTARTMPQALAVLGAILSLALLLKPGDGAFASSRDFRWGRVALLCALMVFYGFAVRPLGFLISTSLLLIGGFVVLGERRLWLVLVASLPPVLLFWALMTQVLSVFIEPWPEFFRT